ncbi:hypothetical protein PAMP_009751 [Pampus punctatissimus]
MPPKQAAKSQKSSKTEATGDTGLADANASIGDSEVEASSNPILNAISAMKGDFVQRFDALFSAIEGIQSDLKAMSARVTEAEDRISTNQDDVASLKTQTNTMKATIENWSDGFCAWTEGLCPGIRRKRDNLRLDYTAGMFKSLNYAL